MPQPTLRVIGYDKCDTLFASTSDLFSLSTIRTTVARRTTHPPTLCAVYNSIKFHIRKKAYARLAMTKMFKFVLIFIELFAILSLLDILSHNCPMRLLTFFLTI